MRRLGIALSITALALALTTMLAAVGCGDGDTGDGALGRRADGPASRGVDDGGRSRRGDVVLVILDTVRADHLSCYGYERETSPHLDRLAAEGERYTNAFAQAPWTLPTIATILTGQPPHLHGAGLGEQGVYTTVPGVETLAESMKRAGYRTGAIMNVIWLDPELSGLGRGFEHYDFRTSDESNLGTRDARATTDAALEWIDGLGTAPFFVVVHYFDAHLTYDPPAPYDTQFEADGEASIEPGFGSAAQVLQIVDGTLDLDTQQRASLIARYDGEIRFLDEQLGRLRADLEDRGRWDDALVVVIGDHGEEFWDHGSFEHGHSHHREIVRVPLIVRRPGGRAGAVRTERVRQLEVMPTVLDFAGAFALRKLPGFVLTSAAAEYAIAEGSLWGGELVSVRSQAGTLIHDRTRDTFQFYASDDVLERHDIAPELAADSPLRAILEALPPVASPESTPTLPTAEQLEQLKALGYVR